MIWIFLLFFPLQVHAADPAELLIESVHRDIGCDMCHSAEVEEGRSMPGVDCSACHEGIYRKYTKSVHGKLRLSGIEDAPTCYSCHGTHDILSMGKPASRVHKLKVPEACGQCHESIFEEYSQSVHGVALAEGIPDTPICTDCHGEHSILPHTDKLSWVYSTNIAKTTCPQCHASERIIAKYNIPGERVESYKDTFHGLAGKIGDVKVANCASCHGVHNIFPSFDKRSMVNPDNMVETCGQCHPNANENFVKGSVHGYEDTALSNRVIQYVTWFYVSLILTVIGGFLFHNWLDYFKKLRAIYRKRRREPYYDRMNLNERIQHGILIVSFFILVITGFALKFGWHFPLVGGEINTLLRSTLHRISGVLMTGVLLYNITYFLLTKRGRKIIGKMRPQLSDVREFIEYVKYLFGRRSERPRFSCFTYWEKMEYWSVVWGGLVMGITGFMLWFETQSLQYIPMWGIDVITLIHYLEAILATLAIFVGHLYFVILNPDVSPISFTWITGRIRQEYALEEHPLEYENRPAETESPEK
jgi:formate dehydrogenase gamma subunit